MVTTTNRVPGSTAQDVPAGLVPCCETCSWCGLTIKPKSSWCVLHEDKCPTFSAAPTLCALQAVASLVLEIGGPLPPRAFDTLESYAQTMHAAGTFPDLAGLICGVWAERGNWADPPKP